MDYDLAVIGGGSAGYAAARTASAEGLRTIVIEGGREIGGLCILRGCMPTKTILESANRFVTLRRAAEFGLHAGNISADPRAILARKRRIIGEFADYRRQQLQDARFEFVRGRASFVDAHTLAVEWPGEADRTLTAANVLIATGSSVQTPPVPGLRECGALTSDEALELDAIPDSLIVLGAGPVALEFAHYFAALGTSVTVIQRGPQLLTGTDPDVAHALQSALHASGICIHTGTKILGVERTPSGRRISFEQAGKRISLEASEILNALGRRPHLEGLNLAAAGVDTPNGLIATNPHQQTSQPHIFAAGDCCGPYEVVHIAIQQGEIAAKNIARRLHSSNAALESMDYRLKLFAVFTEPQVASVGLTEVEAMAQGRSVRSASYPFNDHGKSIAAGETHGFVKLIADNDTGEIVGGAVVGPHASELIHEIVVAMAFRATAAQLATVPHYHPTLSEIWTYPAEDLALPPGT